MEARAEARYIRTSPQKARLVIDLIRGQRAGDAINILRTHEQAHRAVGGKSAALGDRQCRESFNDVDVDKLFVTECYVNEGPRMKRVRPAPMGRAYRYQRRMAHIVVKVGDGEHEGEQIAWARKHIPTGSGWASPRPGGRAGSPSRITPSCCAKIWN